ncbi:response regulator [Cellvibrio japonicus]|uniref:Response regulator n=1 Tax=Cellvibrio japonicus (strain Ueda107) TaxID=498211 RepID=B3PDX5_CELJU|nr:response regulator transcription factor [Cellvibrio japonicus]ACE83213.1 response regulator [Cellvibrio japonicus Ueda107]QEI13457.1 response regulator transcription factor [Cellvibrio japonicus]QEI17031.1 response regulator transcription factor [Cellvibrio japonicus]QEI20609.1 response regulator transcription factor [Cellvibrio japonicus]
MTNTTDDSGGQPAPPVRVLLLEDDTPLRERFARILGDWPGGELVAACATLSEALDRLHRQPVDLLMADLNLPDGHGIEAIQLLRRLYPEADAMVISALADDETVLGAIEAGAVGYLLKDADSLELVEAIQELRAGRSPISSSIARILVRRMGGSTPATPTPELTPRETEILRGIAKGFTYTELAEWLGISRHTVPVHIKNIYRKLAANNRSEAVYEASKRGLIKL